MSESKHDVDTLGQEGIISQQASLSYHDGVINRIAWSPGGQHLASCSNDGTVRIWDADDGLVDTLPSVKPVLCVAWSADGSRLAAGTGDNVIHVWEKDGDGWTMSVPILGHTDWVNSVHWSPSDPDELVSASADRTVQIWRLKGVNRECINCLVHGNNAFNAVYSPDGKTIASASADKSIKLWNKQGDHLHTLIGHTDQVLNIAWSMDGRLLASASIDNRVRIWEALSGKEIVVLEAHTRDVRAVSFSWDGAILASKGADHAVKLWCTQDWEMVGNIPEKAGPAWLPGLSFHPSLPRLASLGKGDRIVRIWDLDIKQLLGSTPAPTVRYTSAKIVLVGESNVGKSCLATRLVEDRYEELGPTFGMRFLHIEPQELDPRTKTPADERREIVLWDLGGHKEFRLVHQLFLPDASLALVVVDPQRDGFTSEDVEAWNRRLEKQLSGQNTVKLLIGAKVDEPSALIDTQVMHQLKRRCGFAEYIETSALTCRGIEELKKAIIKHLDWSSLIPINRPEIFQRVYDEIQQRREDGALLISFHELCNVIRKSSSQDYDSDAIKDVAEAVARQLAVQGVIAYTELTGGERMLVLSIETVGQYASALILAARNQNKLHRIPALEERDLALLRVSLPARTMPLSKYQEMAILESVVELLIRHGICIRDEGLLIFPSLFPKLGGAEEDAPFTPSSYFYDFTGSIDNIYASLVAYLAICGEFGQHRLWANRVEFEQAGQGIFGFAQTRQESGLARLHLFFSDDVDENMRDLFIHLVEEHLAKYGVAVHEHLTMRCSNKNCKAEIPESAVRKNLEEGYPDIICSHCRHATTINKDIPGLQKRTQIPERKLIALRRKIETRTRDEIKKLKSALMDGSQQGGATREEPITILHLSDLHFSKHVSPDTKLQWLLDDLIDNARGLQIRELDFIVISGDMTDKGSAEGLQRARKFISMLVDTFSVSGLRCILVPGNHDIEDIRKAFNWFPNSDESGLSEADREQAHKEGSILLVPDPRWYPRRLEAFSKVLFHEIRQEPYPLDYPYQGQTYLFPEKGIQFLTFNSCWRIDQYNRKRSGVHPSALAYALKTANGQRRNYFDKTEKGSGKKLLRIAVWHHAVSGASMMHECEELLGHLQKNEVKLCMHGDVHEMRRDLIGYWHRNKLHVIGSGSFASPSDTRPESVPRLYNLLEIQPDLSSIRVHTRCQPKPDGPWQGWYEWEHKDAGAGKLPYYDIVLEWADE